MHLSRFIPQFTVRQLMVAVAIAGIVLGVTIERHNRFRKIAAHHQAEFKKILSGLPFHFSGDSSLDPKMRRLEWHEPMRLKYERAARYPWLPVGPDPPEPD
jgi:hypothetical protein